MIEEVSDFIQQLIDNTKNGKIKWDKRECKYGLENITIYEPETIPIVLEYTFPYKYNLYKSNFFGKNVELATAYGSVVPCDNLDKLIKLRDSIETVISEYEDSYKKKIIQKELKKLLKMVGSLK